MIPQNIMEVSFGHSSGQSLGDLFSWTIVACMEWTVKDQILLILHILLLSNHRLILSSHGIIYLCTSGPSVSWPIDHH